jgi:putative oxidoreductase
MVPMFNTLANLHESVFGGLQDAFEDWFLGLLARAVFAAVLLFYFFNSAMTKIAAGPLGFLTITDGAYVQMFPKVMEALSYDTSQLALFPYRLMAYAGTYAEFALPILIVIGLFTRLAALGMIGFVCMQSYVDIYGHGADETTIGAWFDGTSSAAILDQRALWIFLLAYLVIRGAGALSLDHLFAGRTSTRYAY